MFCAQTLPILGSVIVSKALETVELMACYIGNVNCVAALIIEIV